MKRIKRLAALFAALATAIASLTALASCGGENTPDDGTDPSAAVMTLGDNVIDVGTYRYLYSTYKARYLSKYSVADTAEFWRATRADSTTNAAWMDSLIRDSVRMRLAAEYLFETDGLTLPDGMQDNIVDYVNDVKNERFDGDDEKFAAALAEFGTDEEGFRASIAADEKMNALFERYFGSNGVRAVTDEERDEFYRENYVHFAQININDAYAYVEEDGSYVQNEDGSYESRALTEAEAGEKREKIAIVETSLAAGETVESLYARFSENTDYPNGYYFTRANASKYDEEIVSAAFGLDEGETTMLRTEHGTFFIERLALDEGGFAAGNEDFFGDFESAVKNSLFDELLKSYFDKISEDAEAVESLTVAAVRANYDLD